MSQVTTHKDLKTGTPLAVELRKFGTAPENTGLDRRPEQVSVIVPVYNDARRLADCLTCLAAQDFPAESYEVIVVDNGSEDPLDRVCSLFPGVRLVLAPKPGSYAARNRGIAAATGDLLLFTDSDCLPAPDWIGSAVRRFRNRPDINILGGEVVVVSHRESELTLSEWHQHIRGFVQKRNVDEANYAVTANLAVRREVFDRVGLFAEELLSGGDLEWGQRATLAGIRPVYVAELLVRHPARRSLVELLIRYVRTAGGLWSMAEMRGEKRWRLVIANLTAPWRHYWQHRNLTQLRSYGGKAKFLALELLISGVRIVECLRLSLGGQPRRQ